MQDLPSIADYTAFATTPVTAPRTAPETAPMAAPGTAPMAAPATASIVSRMTSHMAAHVTVSSISSPSPGGNDLGLNPGALASVAASFAADSAHYNQSRSAVRRLDGDLLAAEARTGQASSLGFLGGEPQAQQGASVHAAPRVAVRDHVQAFHFVREPYEDFHQDLIRRECTACDIKVPSRTKKENRIRCLGRYDELMATGASSGEAAKQATAEPHRTKHCAFRLLNILFSDSFYEEFQHLGDPLTQEELDRPGPNRHANFWSRVANAFRSINPAIDGLVSEDTAFESICPSVIVLHGPKKLETIWKDKNTAFVIANEKFRVSGTHDSDFSLFVKGRLDVPYLWY